MDDFKQLLLEEVEIEDFPDNARMVGCAEDDLMSECEVISDDGLPAPAHEFRPDAYESEQAQDIRDALRAPPLTAAWQGVVKNAKGKMNTEKPAAKCIPKATAKCTPKVKATSRTGGDIKTDRRNVYSRAYHKAIDEMSKMYSPDEAKSLARAAANKAVAAMFP